MKIDPSVVRPKPFVAVSQHATGGRTHVTTPIRPVLPHPMETPPEPPIFGADPLNFTEGYLSNGEDDEDISKGYFSVKVWSPRVPLSLHNLTVHPAIQDNPLLLWMAERDTFLNELIRLEGTGDFTTNGKCELCRNDGTYRCLDCHAVQSLCGGCLSRVHSFNPFHIVEVSLLISD